MSVTKAETVCFQRGSRTLGAQQQDRAYLDMITLSETCAEAISKNKVVVHLISSVLSLAPLKQIRLVLVPPSWPT